MTARRARERRREKAELRAWWTKPLRMALPYGITEPAPIVLETIVSERHALAKTFRKHMTA